MSVPSSVIKLLSSDGETFSVEVGVAIQSRTIRTMIEDSQTHDSNDDQDEPIPLPNVDAVTLKKVLEFCTHHKDDLVQAERDKENKDKRAIQISDWDMDFLEVNQESVFELIEAANYLDIKSLLDITCTKVGSMIKGKSPEELRKLFDLETPGQEERDPEESK